MKILLPKSTSKFGYRYPRRRAFNWRLDSVISYRVEQDTSKIIRGKGCTAVHQGIVHL